LKEFPISLLGLSLLLSLQSPASAQNPPKKIPESIVWKVQPDELVSFTQTISPKVHHPHWNKNNKWMVEKIDFRRFGYQLLPSDKNPAPAPPFPEGGWGLADDLITKMPPRGTSTGESWSHSNTFDRISTYEAITVRGRYTLVGWVKHKGKSLLRVQGTFQVEKPKKSARSNSKNKDRKTITWVLSEPGTIQTNQWIDPSSGRVVEAKAKFKVMFQHKNLGARLPRKFFNQVTYQYKSQKNISQGDLDGFVEHAVKQGVRWLRNQQQDDGSFKDTTTYTRDYPMGVNALCLLTLLKSGVPSDDPVIVKGFAHLHTLPLKKTYSVGVYLMAIEALHIPLSLKKKESLRPGQAPKGPPAPRKIPTEDRKRMAKAVQWLLDGRREGSNWSYPGDSPSHHDHSNTQYAILGLKAASRCGFSIPSKIWKEIIQYFLKAQESVGPPVYLARFRSNPKGNYKSTPTSLTPAEARGWPYRSGQDTAYASMTTAGLTSLIIARSELVKRKSYRGSLARKCEKSILDGLAWHQHHYDVKTNPGKLDKSHHYYLYGLERVGMLAALPRIGDRSWYDDGARFLVTTQERSGRWENTRATCFALLFLKRATTPVVISGN
jgi:hypothetical protein